MVKQSGITEEEIQTAVTEVHEKATNAASTFLLASANSFCNIRTDHPAHFVPDLSTRAFAAVDVAYTIGTAIDNVFSDKAWAQKLVSSAYSTGNSLMSTFVSVMKPRSFLETAPIHGQMESEANRIIAKYKSKIYEADSKEKQLAAEEDRIVAEKREKKKKIYWEQHAEEKAELDTKIDRLTSESQPLKEQASQLSLQISKLQSEMAPLTPAETEQERLQSLLRDLRSQRASLGIFKGKEKKAIQAQIDELENTLPNVKNQAEQERTDVVTATREKIAPLQKELDSLSEKIRDIETQINEAKYELTRDR